MNDIHVLLATKRFFYHLIKDKARILIAFVMNASITYMNTNGRKYRTILDRDDAFTNICVSKLDPRNIGCLILAKLLLVNTF